MDVEVIVETPQGSRNKYRIDPKSGRIRLDRMLFTSTVYPLDYGKIPGTLAEDGKALDVLIWLDEPTFPGCLVTVRPVAVFWMTDERGPDAKLLGVAAHDVRKARIRDLPDVPRHLLNEIGHFFDIYKELEPGKSTDVRGWMDRAEAERVIKEAEARAGHTATESVPDQRAGSKLRVLPARRLSKCSDGRQLLSLAVRCLTAILETTTPVPSAPGQSHLTRSRSARVSSRPRSGCAAFPAARREPGARHRPPSAACSAGTSREQDAGEERGGVVSAIEIPAGSLFGLDNLPYGIFTAGGAAPRAGVRVAGSVIDLAAALRDEVFTAPALNPFMAEGPARWAAARARIAELITGADVPARAIHPLREVEVRLPFEVADYVDFYASEHHASNVGRLFRPGGKPLTSNWKHLPIGYHGRSGTVIVSGTNVIRPSGQRKGPNDPAPVFGPSVRLDIEAELGFVVGAGSPHGTPVPASAFADHVFGAVLVNDWSARDLQAWEYVPLGPHLGKSFATSVSAWVVPLAALRAARVPLPGQDPPPLPYLRETENWGLDIDLAVTWNGEVVSRPPYRTMYWSPAQMLAHMTVNGASVRTGDLFASGTISGPERAQRGAFLELTWGGAEPVTVNGELRTFLEDGDTVTITATAPGTSGGRIGFGEVTATILPARTAPLPAEL